MSQIKYALDILQDMRLTGARPDKFPNGAITGAEKQNECDYFTFIRAAI